MKKLASHTFYEGYEIVKHGAGAYMIIGWHTYRWYSTLREAKEDIWEYKYTYDPISGKIVANER